MPKFQGEEDIRGSEGLIVRSLMDAVTLTSLLICRYQPEVGIAVVNSHSDSFAIFILHGSLHEPVRA